MSVPDKRSPQDARFSTTRWSLVRAAGDARQDDEQTLSRRATRALRRDEVGRRADALLQVPGAAQRHVSAARPPLAYTDNKRGALNFYPRDHADPKLDWFFRYFTLEKGIALGVQTVFSSFLISLLGMRRK